MHRVIGSASAALLVLFVLVVLGLGVAFLFLRSDRGDPDAGGRPEPGNGAHAPAPSGGSPPAQVPMEATTEAQVRDIVKFADSATEKDLPELRRLALESPDPLVAGNAVRALGRLKAVIGDAGVLRLLDDHRERVRQEMVGALGASGSPDAIKLLAAVLDKREPTVRPLAIQALGRLGLPEGKPLLEAIVNDRSTSAVEMAFAREALKAIP